MQLDEVFAKVGKSKIKEALECEDSTALQKLLDDSGVKLSDEQLDYIAGGVWVDGGGSLAASCFTDGKPEPVVRL